MSLYERLLDLLGLETPASDESPIQEIVDRVAALLPDLPPQGSEAVQMDVEGLCAAVWELEQALKLLNRLEISQGAQSDVADEISARADALSADSNGRIATYAKIYAEVVDWRVGKPKSLANRLLAWATTLAQPLSRMSETLRTKLYRDAGALHPSIAVPIDASVQDVGKAVLRADVVPNYEGISAPPPQGVLRDIVSVFEDPPATASFDQTEALAAIDSCMRDLVSFRIAIDTFGQCYVRARDVEEAALDLDAMTLWLTKTATRPCGRLKTPRRRQLETRCALRKLSDDLAAWIRFFTYKRSQLNLCETASKWIGRDAPRLATTVAILGTGGSLAKHEALEAALAPNNSLGVSTTLDLINFLQPAQILFVAAAVAIAWLAVVRLRHSALQLARGFISGLVGKPKTQIEAARVDWGSRLALYLVLLPAVSMFGGYKILSQVYRVKVGDISSQDAKTPTASTALSNRADHIEGDQVSACVGNYTGHFEEVARLGSTLVLACRGGPCIARGFDEATFALKQNETLVVRQPDLQALSSAGCMGNAATSVTASTAPPPVTLSIPERITIELLGPPCCNQGAAPSDAATHVVTLSQETLSALSQRHAADAGLLTSRVADAITAFLKRQSILSETHAQLVDTLNARIPTVLAASEREATAIASLAEGLTTQATELQEAMGAITAASECLVRSRAASSAERIRGIDACKIDEQ